MTTPTSNTENPAAVWCGGCSLVPDDAYAATCPRWGSPLVGVVADQLRALTLDHHAALRDRRTDDAYDLAMEHTRLKARSAVPTAPARSREPVTASKVVSWLGAGLVVAGGIAFAAVVWNVAGGVGRLAILALVTLLAFAGAWLLRRRTPVTAEALTLVAAGMVVVDAIVPVAAGYVVDDGVTPWFAASSALAATVFVLLGRAWGSTTARVAGVVLGSAAGAAFVTMVFDLVGVTSDVEMLVVAGIGGLLVAGTVVAADLLSRWPRMALLAGAWTAWAGLGVAVLFWDAFGALDTGRSAEAPWTTPAAMLALTVAPLVSRPRTVATGSLLGLAAAGPAAWAAMVLTTSHLYDRDASAPIGIVAGALAVAAVVLVGLALGRGHDEEGAARRTRGTVLGLVLTAIWAMLAGTSVFELANVQGLAPAAYALLGIAAVAGAARASGARLLPQLAATALETLVATAGLSGAVLLITVTSGWPGGLVAGTASVLAAVASLLVPERHRLPLWCTAAVTLLLAPALGTTAIEQVTVPAAAVALVLMTQFGRATGTTSSWFTEMPAAVLLLVPTLWVGLADGDAARLASVAVVATGVMVLSGWRHRQGPAVVSTAALAAVALWALAPRLSDIPLWAVLTGCGALLLWVGFTWEARRTTAKHLVQRWSEWT